MKQQYVPIEKQSKRKQKEFHSKQRRDWGDISPVTKAVQSAKLYNRKKSKHRCEHEPGLDFFYVMLVSKVILISKIIVDNTSRKTA